MKTDLSCKGMTKNHGRHILELLAPEIRMEKTADNALDA